MPNPPTTPVPTTVYVNLIAALNDAVRQRDETVALLVLSQLINNVHSICKVVTTPLPAATTT